jgi:Flp pilus assembly pilin Flp
MSIGSRIANFYADERGQATTEYVLILALFIVPVALIFRQLSSVFRELLDSLNRLVMGPGI